MIDIKASSPSSSPIPVLFNHPTFMSPSSFHGGETRLEDERRNGEGSGFFEIGFLSGLLVALLCLFCCFVSHKGERLFGFLG